MFFLKKFQAYSSYAENARDKKPAELVCEARAGAPGCRSLSDAELVSEARAGAPGRHLLESRSWTSGLSTCSSFSVVTTSVDV